ncbi:MULTISPECIES: DNA repair protein RecO [Deinococcus]|jgi:DNA repair protein RecO (recombination protein O)|uniref:DNA repair protein RecO n=3 Tax=Deinococcus TaxID=1298 RepID=A0A221SX49_9DEIO|nr:MULTISPECIES: DNA repair protein RecO [Deinococcus]ASN81176.1 DNA repair protein RecO [Deinococcus ficus]MDP9763226.1 DNA repair protein RecO (recombination protein O) [Deinococcus enclensis]GHF67757.1 DNA repair protein RecO [Deinococcus ficus]
MRARTANRSGIVIRRRVTPAGDIIVTLLTPQGKLKAVARGGVKGPLTSSLNLFHHVAVQVYQGPHNDLASVKQAVLEGALPTLAEPGRYAYAHLMAEFADALFQEGEFSEQAFDLFSGALRGISRQPDPEWVALVMSYKLLGLAGIVPQTARCARCGTPDPAHPDPLGGQLLCGNCAALPPYPDAALDFLQGVVRRTVRASMDTPVPPEQRPALWRALERFVTVQIGGVHSWTQLVPMQAAASG